MRYSEEKVKAANNYLNKIWNSARYILMNVPADFKLNIEHINKKKLNLVDKFILTKLEAVIKKITEAMDSYEYGVASNLLYNFVYDDFCSFYLEMSKVSLKDEANYNDGTYFTMIYALKAIIMMIYPFSPFIAEEIYLSLPEHKDSIMLESYPDYEKGLVFKSSIQKVELIRKAIESVREYKVKNSLAPNEKLDLSIKTNLKLDSLYKYLERFSFAKSLVKVEDDVKDSSSIILPDLTIYIKDNIDKSELKDKLTKEFEKINAEIKRSEGILSNQGFLARAPQAKIQLEKEKYEKYKALHDEIEEKLKKL